MKAAEPLGNNETEKAMIQRERPLIETNQGQHRCFQHGKRIS